MRGRKFGGPKVHPVSLRLKKAVGDSMAPMSESPFLGGQAAIRSEEGAFKKVVRDSVIAGLDADRNARDAAQQRHAAFISGDALVRILERGGYTDAYKERGSLYRKLRKTW